MEQYGFSPKNTGEQNRIALQKAVDQEGTITIVQPGTYEIKDSIILKGDTHLIFGAGVYIKRSTDSVNSFAFTNIGGFTREYDYNITIEGLYLITSGIEARENKQIYGLTGELSFHYVKNLTIRNFQCYDLPPLSYGIHICTYENILIENLRIEGRKDAVHLGFGSKFVIRHGIFKTFDDPIALNAHDYSIAQPQLGWIENGLIEDCYDLNDTETVGFFCRILAGSWVDWFSGMEIQNSDTVISNGKLYRAFLFADGTNYFSITPPTHDEGEVVLDGIKWVKIQDDVVYNCGCRNIHFKDIFLQKKRNAAFSIHFDNDRYSRSYYPNSIAPVQENLVFENITFENEINNIITSATPVDSIKFINSVLGKSKIRLTTLPTEGLNYPTTKILLSGTTFTSEENHDLVECVGTRDCTLKVIGSLADEEFTGTVKGNVKVLSSDINIVKE